MVKELLENRVRKKYFISSIREKEIRNREIITHSNETVVLTEAFKFEAIVNIYLYEGISLLLNFSRGNILFISL